MDWLRVWLGRPGNQRLLIIVGFAALLEELVRARTLPANQFAAPSVMFTTLWDQFASGAVWPHLVRTASSVLIAYVLAVIAGLLVGLLLWRLPAFAKMCQPYLVAFQAMPLAFFYPLLLVLLGLGMGPIVIIASLTAVVPIIINTMVAFGVVSPIYHKVALSLNATPVQTYLKVLAPAAAPMIFAGLKIGFVYALVVTIGMEFIIADKGIGYLVGWNYEYFETNIMYAYILLNLLLAVLVNITLLRGESTMRKELA